MVGGADSFDGWDVSIPPQQAQGHKVRQSETTQDRSAAMQKGLWSWSSALGNGLHAPSVRVLAHPSAGNPGSGSCWGSPETLEVRVRSNAKP